MKKTLAYMMRSINVPWLIGFTVLAIMVHDRRVPTLWACAATVMSTGLCLLIHERGVMMLEGMKKVRTEFDPDVFEVTSLKEEKRRNCSRRRIKDAKEDLHKIKFQPTCFDEDVDIRAELDHEALKARNLMAKRNGLQVRYR